MNPKIEALKIIYSFKVAILGCYVIMFAYLIREIK